MGDYADLTIDETIGTWDGRSSALYGLDARGLKETKTCNSCGYKALYWAKHEGKWRLHHWALLPSEKKPRFVLHRCGFTSDGKPKHALPPERTDNDR